MQPQSGLGERKIHRHPSYNESKIARVTSTKDFHAFGRIEVIFLDYGQPSPVWVATDIDREPVEGDQVLVGYLDGRQDAPYMVGFVKNESYTTNFIVVKKDKIKFQLPIFEIGTKDGVAHNDVKTHLLDNDKQGERAYVELVPDYALISFPTSKTGATPPARIKITASEVIIDHPGAIKHHGGSKGAARVGDSVQVNLSTGLGTITSGSGKTLID